MADRRTAKFIYGSNEMNKLAGYDNEADYGYSRASVFDESSFCNGDCFNCEVICPYQK